MSEHTRVLRDLLHGLAQPAKTHAPVDFTEITIIGGRKIGLSDRGDLYQWVKAEGRWVRLELTTNLIPFRRKRYAGHPSMRPRP